MTEIISLKNFIIASRDSGYKSLAYALAEIIDNAFDANATQVSIVEDRATRSIIISDDGYGMRRGELAKALAFGWSSRFDGRNSHGRYGMGLPNSSLSQGFRVDLYSWQKKTHGYHTYIDVDEIISGHQIVIPSPKKIAISKIPGVRKFVTGTVVVWSKMDKCTIPLNPQLIERLQVVLGRIYRYHLWNGKRIFINDEPIRPRDPLMIKDHPTDQAACLYGNQLTYAVGQPWTPKKRKQSIISVCFSLLPVERWHALEVAEKRKYGITRGGGVSVLRGGREIDLGWFFMGTKRRENYDDWWRCEVHFEPELDELFGLTNNKQNIRPTEFLNNLLSPDLSGIARQLNYQVRKQHEAIKHISKKSEDIVSKANNYLKPLPGKIRSTKTVRRDKIEIVADASKKFILTKRKFGELLLTINKNHPFYSRCYAPFIDKNSPRDHQYITILELLLFALGRADVENSNPIMKKHIDKFIEEVSDIIVAYTEHWK